MSYEVLAQFYDELMSDVPYEEWLAWTIAHLPQEKEATLLDLGCGTGTLTIELAKHIQTIGLDYSENMLAVAYEKAQSENVNVLWLESDMRNFEVPNKVHCVTCFVDGINYLTTEEDVRATFTSVRQALHKDGMFLFDVHTPYKMTEVFPGYNYSGKAEDVAWMWHIYEGQHENEVEHELAFFLKDAQEKYDRVDELHVQRTFTAQQYTKWLEQVGFVVESVGDDTHWEDREEPERLFFTCRAV
ncbi:MAG: class I SAM-dependent DNA methyltransferase [Bacilli bacterium]